ncbi:MAG: molybdopterin cofactor-binding domain-containing protein, partial [Candidatus Asgardarchaeum sp.]
MKKELKYIGKNIPLSEAYFKVTGKLKFTGDMKLDSMLHCKLLLSTVAHAKIKKIDISEALKFPGVVAIYTYLNTPKITYNTQVWNAIQKPVAEDQRIISDKARFVGDKIAAVVAENEESAKKATRLIKVEYEDLPAYFDPEEIIGKKEVNIHDIEEPFFRKKIECGNIEKGFQEADIVVEDRVVTPKLHHAAIENHICIAYPDDKGKITVLSPCQIPFAVRLIVGKVL